jgi:hypothetical protein
VERQGIDVIKHARLFSVDCGAESLVGHAIGAEPLRQA